jgi:hypothetical protein
MAKSLTPVVAFRLVEPKSSLKSSKTANVRVNDVPTSFNILQQKPVTMPAPSGDVRIVTAAEYKQAAACLADAFAEDDVAMYFIDVPDRAHWTEQQGACNYGR